MNTREQVMAVVAKMETEAWCMTEIVPLSKLFLRWAAELKSAVEPIEGEREAVAWIPPEGVELMKTSRADGIDYSAAQVKHKPDETYTIPLYL